MRAKLLISLFLGGCLSISALYLAFRNVPLSDLTVYLKAVNYWWLVPAVAVIALTFVLRVLRWQLILRGAQKVPFWPAFHPLMIGFMMNCILPGRVGELARPVLLKKERQVPLATGLATVAAERLFDIVCLILLFAGVFSTIASGPDIPVHFGSQTVSSRALHSGAGILIRMALLLLFMLAIFAVPQVRQKLVQALTALLRRPRLADSRLAPFLNKTARAGIAFIEHFGQGLSLVSNPIQLIGCMILTGMIWALTVGIYYFVAMGFPGLGLSLWQWTTVMVVICFFIALPSVPGFWGLWEAGGIFALSLFNIGNEKAAGYILVNHAVQVFPVILIGLLSAVIASVNIFQLGRVEPNRPQLRNGVDRV